MDEPWTREDGTGSSPVAWPPAQPEERLLAAVRDVFEVWSTRRVGSVRSRRVEAWPRPADTLEIRGRLLVPPEEAYDRVAERFRALGHVALFRRGGQDDLILAVPGELPTGRGRIALAVALFAATFASALFIGAAQGPESGGALHLTAGLPYAVSLMAILLAHEMGHYLMARRLGVPSSPPFFIPLPLPPFGTLGAVMQMKAPPQNRRSLLAVAIAGPLAGLAVAIPVLLLGLSLSPVQQFLPGTGGIQEGNSLLYAALKYAVFGRFLPSGGYDVSLGPVAWAGWAGLFVTGLNLLPAGQLDGGHVAYVLLGSRARYLTYAVMAALLGLSMLWPGWLLWVLLVFVFGQIHAVPLDDLTPLRRRERLLAAAMLALFVLVFIPVPLTEI